MIYTVTCAPALDYALWLDRMIPGDVNRAQRTRLFVGGKGINVSLVLRELGIPSVCLGFAAGFTGSEIVRRLRQEGLNEQMVRLENGLSRINVKLKGAEETEINASGPAVDEAAMHAFLRRLEALGPGDVLVLSGGRAPGTCWYRWAPKGPCWPAIRGCTAARRQREPCLAPRVRGTPW